MPIQLDKILQDIAGEKILHPNYPNATKKDIDDAWLRVGKKNKLSVHEARSIFKVLQKKYEQERVKDASAWKLFGVMDEIHKKIELKSEVKQEDEETELPMEEDEEYEMLEVQEEEDHGAVYPTPASTGSASDNESPTKSMKSNSSTGSPEKDEKPSIKTLTPKQHGSSPHVEEKKILNSLPPVSNKHLGTPLPSAAAAAALQKKGITMKKTSPTTPVSLGKTSGSAAGQSPQIRTTPVRTGASSMLEVGKTIQLPESIKRKLSEEQSTQQSNKRPNTVGASSHTTAQTQIKTERGDQSPQQAQTSPQRINIITIPANPTRSDLTNGSGQLASASATNVASTSTNGFSPRIEDIDFRNDIIFDSGTGNAINGGQQGASRVNPPSEIINLGNFDNSLPPTFFKNLCNSSRHEALGLYVANVMNRLGSQSAAKLELGILRAIIDVQSEELTH